MAAVRVRMCAPPGRLLDPITSVRPRTPRSGVPTWCKAVQRCSALPNTP